MVNDEWLKNNESFNLRAYLADNGKAWGDARDPEELEETGKQAAAATKRKSKETLRPTKKKML